MENNNLIDATAAYEIAIKGLAERQKEKRRKVWEAIENAAAAGNFYVLEDWLSDDLIAELGEKGFRVNYSKGMFMENGYFKIDWSKDEN